MNCKLASVTFVRSYTVKSDTFIETQGQTTADTSHTV